MRILMLSSFLPYPLNSGGHVRLFNLIKELSDKHKITLVCEKRANQTNEDIAAVEKFCEEVVVVARKKQWSLNNMFRTGFSSYPFLLIGHTQSKITEAIYDLLSKNKFDLIHVETFYVMQNLPQTSLPVVLIEHNIEYLVYQRYVNKLPLMFRPFLMLDVWKIKYWEQQFWKKATRVVAVSDHEKKIIGRSDTAVVPNGVDLNKFKFRSTNWEKKVGEKRILFIGDFKWVKNVDALSFVLKNVWQEFGSELKLWVVGTNIPNHLKKLASNYNNVIFDENSNEKTEDIFAKAFLLLAPIRVGGGTSFKILEAMACGVPVVTTSIGAEGINAKDNKDIIIADTKEHIVKSIEILISDKKLYDSVGRSARKLIEKDYDWKSISKKLEDVYNEVVKNS